MLTSCCAAQHTRQLRVGNVCLSCCVGIGLMEHLKQLQYLQHLEMVDMAPCLFEQEGDSTQLPLAALTALTRLTALEVRESKAEALTYEIANQQEGRALPKLRLLRIDCSSVSGERNGLCTLGLQHIAGSCSNLQQLSLLGCVHSSADVGALKQLSNLQQLEVSGDASGDEAAAEVAQISSLQYLEWDSSGDLTLAGLQQFAALTALTQLDVSGCAGLAARYKPMREDDDWLCLRPTNMESVTEQLSRMTGKWAQDSAAAAAAAGGGSAQDEQQLRRSSRNK